MQIALLPKSELDEILVRMSFKLSGIDLVYIRFDCHFAGLIYRSGTITSFHKESVTHSKVLDGTLKSTDNLADFLEEIHNNK